ncbi:hypothetical protein C8R44DRAFT_733356 [Mycena epipterygia]|nr:hypothetical protein C8R44DRAFT_733356 [Mycena epipterygia]
MASLGISWDSSPAQPVSSIGLKIELQVFLKMELTQFSASNGPSFVRPGWTRESRQLRYTLSSNFWAARRWRMWSPGTRHEASDVQVNARRRESVMSKGAPVNSDGLGMTSVRTVRGTHCFLAMLPAKFVHQFEGEAGDLGGCRWNIQSDNLGTTLPPIAQTNFEGNSVLDGKLDIKDTAVATSDEVTSVQPNLFQKRERHGGKMSETVGMTEEYDRFPSLRMLGKQLERHAMRRRISIAIDFEIEWILVYDPARWSCARARISALQAAEGSLSDPPSETAGSLLKARDLVVSGKVSGELGRQSPQGGGEVGWSAMGTQEFP